MIRVLVAEDSITVSNLLVAMLNTDPEIEVIGQAKNGIEAVVMTKRLKPDLVTMDIQMPLMDGFAATKEIMIESPTPIVIVSGHVDVREVTVTMQALRAGALAVLPKPVGPQAPDFEELSRQLLETVKAMSQVKVVRHRAKRPVSPPAPLPVLPPPRKGVGCAVVAIAISTGGPAALHTLLSGLPGDFPVPILVVQHITKGFVEGLAAWLNTGSSLRVKVAENGEQLVAHTMYIAPDDRHLGVSSKGTIMTSGAPPVRGFRPSGTFLFESVANVYGASAVAVIMTGMGNDGLDGLRAIRAAGGRIVAQDEETSVVFGMPGSAINAGLSDIVLPLAAIVVQLGNRVNLT